jgi:DNA repair protein RadA
MVKEAKDKVHEMLSTSEGWETFDKELKDLPVKCVLQPLSEPTEPVSRLKTNTLLDDILGKGGLTAGKTLELYGEYASGKTQVIFTLVVEAASEGIVIFIDVEDTFSRERILQIAKERHKDIEKINANIFLYQPDGWEEQLAVTSQIPDPLPAPIKLIVVDSLMALFRSTPEFGGRSKLGKRQELIRYHLRQLKKLAKEHGAIVAFTNQVYDEPIANPFLPKWACQKAAGGHSVWHIGDFRIFLRKATGNVRIARLVDNAELPPAERPFQINEKGIDDLSDEQQKLALEKLQKYEEAQSAGQFTKVKKKKTTTEDMVEETVKEGEEVEETEGKDA